MLFRSSAYLDIQTAESALSDLGPSPGRPAAAMSVSEASAVYLNTELRQRILNLMRFEDLHDWLAPTGDSSHLLEDIAMHTLHIDLGVTCESSPSLPRC